MEVLKLLRVEMGLSCDFLQTFWCYALRTLFSIVMSEQEAFNFLPGEILQILEAQFEETCLKKTQVYHWLRKFFEGRGLRQKSDSPQEKFLQLFFGTSKGCCTLTFSMNVTPLMLPTTTASYWGKQNVSIGGKDGDSYSER